MKTVIERPDLLTTNQQSTLLGYASELSLDYQPNIAILIRTKNDERLLPSMLAHISSLETQYSGRIDTIIVDTESHDKTLEYAAAFGATVVPLLQSDFTYPRSLNKGLAAVSPDIEATFITVGHALPVVSTSITATVQPFADPLVSGVYGTTALNDNASITEKLTLQPCFSRQHSATNPHKMGLFGATNAMIRMKTWQKYPFDEDYAGGGEDTAWARAAIKRGEKIIFEPLASVHHTHGVSPVNALRQWIHWWQVSRQATTFDSDKLRARRPDLG